MFSFGRVEVRTVHTRSGCDNSTNLKFQAGAFPQSMLKKTTEMIRKLIFSSAALSALLSSGAMAQVVNFHDANNEFPLHIGGSQYEELFAGQGAYADSGNDIWNGFGQYAGPGEIWFYSGAPGSGPVWPQQYGNPGNPYAAYFGQSGWTNCTGKSLYNYNSASAAFAGNADSGGQWTPITLSVGGYLTDNGGLYEVPIPNGSPGFLLSNAAIITNGTEVFTLQNVPTNDTYGLYLYGVNFANNRGTLFSVNSGNAHNAIAATLNGQNGAPDPTFVEGQNFVIFESVTPDTNGNITITAAPNPEDGVDNTNLSGEADFDGLQLIFNPPPTAVGSTAAQNVFAGGTANFSFSPAFATNPSFRWQFISAGSTNNLSDGGNISGSATTNLTIANVSAANAGLYRCLISASTATNTSPAAPLTILTSTFANVLQPGDTLSDFGDNTNPPYNSIPPPFFMTVTSVEDNTLYQYENFGANGSTAPFKGPVGFIVTPLSGASHVTGMRLFAASSHPEDDPADYLLEGSNNGTNFTTISGGLLALPAPRNAAGGAIDVTSQVLQELDFANTAAYTTYRLTFTNVNDNAIASNGVQIAEVQLLSEELSVGPPVVTFNGNGTDWTLNEGAVITPTISNNVLTLTDGGASEASSAIFDTPQAISGFIASYTYQATGSGAADGITFCLQNSPLGTNAVGQGSEDLGYTGITPSAAFEMNIYTGAPGGAGIQFGTNGSTPGSTNPIAPYFSTLPVNLASGDPIYVQLYYIQNVLNVWLVDAKAGTKYATNFSVPDLPAIVGGSNAFIGFTGGTGSATSIQTVSNFVYSYTVPPVLSVTRGAPGSVVVSWPGPVSSLFALQQSASLSGPWSNVTVTPQVVNSQNQVTLTPAVATFYRLTLK
jgi:hypothetical protein